MNSEDNTQHSVRSDCRRLTVLVCVECGALSGLRAAGWRGYRIDEPDTDELPQLAFYCPTCSLEHFG